MRIAVFRTAHFNAAHRLANDHWTLEKNLEVFGICYNPRYHGHNYDMEVKLVGETDPETGFLVNLSILKDIIENTIIIHFDHKNLNEEVEEFQTMNPTVENICFVIWTRLRKEIRDDIELTVRLYETPRNYAEYPA